MHARTSSKGRLPSRHVTAGESTDAALRLLMRERGTAFDAAKIFKKTPCAADLKRRGRYVAKDIGEIVQIPLLPHTSLGFGADVGTPNVKLTGVERAEHKTKGRFRATHHTSGALGNDGQQIGPALDGAVTRPGGAHEKQCYADI